MQRRSETGVVGRRLDVQEWGPPFPAGLLSLRPAHTFTHGVTRRFWFTRRRLGSQTRVLAARSAYEEQAQEEKEEGAKCSTSSGT
eukprot:1418168-Pyramimonas_sp.AAC.1